MCYDTEKTQAPVDSRIDERLMHEIREKQSAYANQAGMAGQCGREKTSKEILDEFFSYHPPTPHTLPNFQAINQAAKNFAEVVLQNCPSSQDRSNVINMIRAARMWANAAIALNGLSL